MLLKFDYYNQFNTRSTKKLRYLEGPERSFLTSYANTCLSIVNCATIF